MEEEEEMKQIIVLLLLLPVINSVNADPTSFIILVDSNDIISRTTSSLLRFQLGLKDINLDIRYLNDIDILEEMKSDWDLSLIKIPIPLPQLGIMNLDFVKSNSFLHQLINFNNSFSDLVSNGVNLTEFDSAVDRLHDILSFETNINSVISIFMNRILSAFPLFTTLKFFSSPLLPIAENFSIYQSLSMYPSPLDSVKYAENNVIFSSFDPLQFSQIPQALRPMLSTLLMINNERIVGVDLAKSFMINDYNNTKFQQLPSRIENSNITFILGNQSYSDGKEILSQDIIFTIQLLKRLGDPRVSHIIDYKLNNNKSISIYLDSNFTGLHPVMGDLFPTPSHILNRTLHLGSDPSIEFQPLSSAYLFSDSIEWSNFAGQRFSSGKYLITDDSRFGIPFLEFSSIDNTTLCKSITIYGIPIANQINQKDRLDIIASNDWLSIHDSPNITQHLDHSFSYFLLFNHQRFDEYSQRLSIASMLDKEYIAELLHIAPQNSLISPISPYYSNYDFYIPSTTKILNGNADWSITVTEFNPIRDRPDIKLIFLTPILLLIVIFFGKRRRSHSN